MLNRNIPATKEQIKNLKLGESIISLSPNRKFRRRRDKINWSKSFVYQLQHIVNEKTGKKKTIVHAVNIHCLQKQK